MLLKVRSETGIDVTPLFKITPGLSKGLCGCGDICGALVSGGLILGLVYGKEIDKNHPFTLIKTGLIALIKGNAVFEKKELHPSFSAGSRVGRLYRAFVNKFGSANCRDILNRKQTNIKNTCKDIINAVSQWTVELISLRH